MCFSKSFGIVGRREIGLELLGSSTAPPLSKGTTQATSKVYSWGSIHVSILTYESYHYALSHEMARGA